MFLIILSISSYTLSATPTAYASSPRSGDEDNSDINSKFEPWLWEKIQALKSNGTMRDLSLMIRLKTNQRINGMQIQDLKRDAVSLFTSIHNAAVFSVLRVLPVVLAKVSVTEVEKIASYEFVESIGDGEGKGSLTLNASRSAIRADDVETAFFGLKGNNITIAILDTGINSSHPDLDDLDDDPTTYDPKVIEEVCYVDLNDDNVTDQGPEDEVGHGTHVAGIAAGTGEASGYQYNGTAPGAFLMNIKVAYKDQYKQPAGFQWNDVEKGIDHALIKKADVICICLGERQDGDGTHEVAKALDDAVDQGVVVIAAAGNIRPYGSQKIATPADAFNVITVGAVDDNNTKDIGDDIFWDGGCRGPTGDKGGGRPKPDVVAPGVNIIAPMDQGAALWQANPGSRVENFYYSGTGTSAAAPHVAGTAALMLEMNPDLTPAQVKAILRQTARLNNNLNGLTVNDRGHGIIDAYEAVQLARKMPLLINRSHMYDSWDVETPDHWWDPIGEGGDYLKFTVGAPSSAHGIPVYNVHYYYWDWGPIPVVDGDYSLLNLISARHVWINDIYYDLGTKINVYLFSGPRIYEKGSGYVRMRARYKVGNVFVEYDWKIHYDEIWLKLNFVGGSSWSTLIYIDPDIWDSMNYARRPSTGETILCERTITGDVLLDIRDQDHTEYVQIDPTWTDNPTMWVLKYDGYFGNDPNSVQNGQVIKDANIVVYYQALSDLPDPGPTIYRKTNPPATRDTTQDDAGTGDDAGNNFVQATSVNSGGYDGILWYSDPEDTADWYKFQVENSTNISVSMTPPQDIDFDLQLYDPSGNLKAASYLGPGQEDSVSYTTDSSGCWRAKIYIHDGEAQYSFQLINHSGGGGGGGGCPILYVYNGAEYISEGLLDIHNPDGIDVVKNHTLITKPRRVEAKYLLRLTEHPQTISYIDKVKLFAILQDKTLIGLPLISAIHSEQGDVLPQLLSSDDWRTDTLGANWNNGTSQSIELKFQALPPKIKVIGFVFQIEGNNPLFK